MAFVFEEPRWKQISQIQFMNPGPGAYNQNVYQKHKLGIITPLKKEVKIESSSKSQQSIDWEIITTQKHKQKLSQSKLKIKQNFTIDKKKIKQDQKHQNLSLEIVNNIQGIRKQFENNIIKSSLGEAQKNSIHSATSSFHNKNLFSDNKIRSIKHQKTKQQINFCIKPSNQQNNLDKKTLSKQPKKGNNYNALKQNINLKKYEKQNFIIAPQNLKQGKRSVISAKNSKCFIKKQQSKFKDFSLTTRIQDDCETSFEYFQNATPGPGTYNINKSCLKVNQCKIEMFGVKQNRFKQKSQYQKLSYLNYKIPSYKKSSKASQDKVAFGKNHFQQVQKQKQEMLIYQDLNSIQNKSLKNLIKYGKKEQNFLSNCQRFNKIKKNIYNGSDFMSNTEFTKNKSQLPNYMFMSKVNRQHSPQTNITKEIDFHGQDFYAIQKNIKRKQQNRQIIEKQLPAFSKSESRFNYEPQFQNLSLSKITNNFIKSTNVTRSTSAFSKKGFTFSKCQNSEKIIHQLTPDPWKYQVPQKWIKQSHHLRFKYK